MCDLILDAALQYCVGKSAGSLDDVSVFAEDFFIWELVSETIWEREESIVHRLNVVTGRSEDALPPSFPFAPSVLPPPVYILSQLHDRNGLSLHRFLLERDTRRALV